MTATMYRSKSMATASVTMLILALSLTVVPLEGLCLADDALQNLLE